MNTSVRPATTTTGGTALAIVAILTLLISLFAVARPAIAFHEGEGNEGPEVPATSVGPNDATWGSDAGGNVPCPAGTTTFDMPVTDGIHVLSLELSDGSTATVTVTVDGNSLDFEVDNGLAQQVNLKAGNGANVYDYSGGAFSGDFPGPGIAHDDGLISPVSDDISNLQVCVIPAPKGSILIYKNDQTGAPVGGATFSVKNDDDEEVGVIITEADGFGCLDELLFGDYTVTETLAPDGWLPDPATQPVTVNTASTCDERLEGAVIADADATFTNTLLGSLLVLKTDDSDATLDGATFTVRNEAGMVVGSFTSGDDGDGLFCVDGLVFGDEYEVTEDTAPDGYSKDITNPRTHTIDVSDDCETREDGPDLTFVNIEDEDLGSITIIKEIDCEICETETPGRWFNVGQGGPGVEFAQDSLDAETGDPIVIGTTEYDYEAAQAAWKDAPGSLLAHTLSLELNVRWNLEENDCDLASLIYVNDENPYGDGTWTVGELLAEAKEILAAGGDDEDLKNAIDDIESQNPGDGTLVCDDTTTGTNGFEFTLFDKDGVEVDAGETGDDGDGTLVFGDLDLELSPYTLEETGGPEGCSILSASGDGVSFDEETGVITITLGEGDDAHVTVTVVNECAPPPPPPPTTQVLGSITIIKDAAPNNAQDFAFTTTGTGLSSFSLDDDADATLSNSRTFSSLAAGSYTVTESATDGWTLTSITCSTGGTGNTTSRTASITLAAGANVTCTFLNTQVTGGTLPGGGGPSASTPPATTAPTPTREGTLADTALESPLAGTQSVLLLGLIMLTSSLTAAAYVTGMEGRRRR